MKQFTVRLSFTDRKQGPSTGRSISINGGSVTGALAKASREFWKGLDTKQRRDVRRDGLKIEVQDRILLDTESDS